MQLHLSTRSRCLHAIARGTLAVLLTLWTASAASAQPTHNQGPNLGTWTVGYIDLQLAASGGGGNGTYVWSLVSGSLPPGVSLRADVPPHYPANANAGLNGIATTPGTYNFTLRVTSAGLFADRAYTWKISALTPKDNNLPDGFVGRPFSYQFTALNNVGAVTWTATNTLPPGLTLAPNGVLSGTPTTAGFFNVNFRIDDGVDVTFHGRSLPIFAIAIPTDGTLPNATQNAGYSASITAVGGSGGYTFTACPGNTVGTNCLPGASALPNGLVMDSTGVISGTVNTGTGRYTFTVTATDTNGVSYSKLMTIQVISTPPSLPSIGLYGSFFDDCAIGLTCSLGLFVSNGGEAPFSWSASGLPSGMSIRTGSGITSQYVSPGDGELWGVPAAVGNYNVRVTVTDSKGVTSTNTFPFHISQMWLSNFLVNGTIGVPYSSKLRVIGGRSPHSVVLKSGTLPAGLTFDPATFVLSGTPLENSQFNFSFDPVFVFTDADGNTFEHHSYFGVAAGPTSTIAINNGNNLGTRTLNAFFSQQLSACCLPSFVWSVVGGSMPPGVTLSSDGVLVGTPSAEGVFTFLVQAADPTNAANVALRQFTLTITSLAPAVAPFTLPIGNVGTPYSTSLAGAGVTGLTWTFTSRTYPPQGFTLDSATGLLHGTPQASGQYFFSVDINDGAGRLVTRNFGLAIYPAGTNPPLNLNIGPNFGPLVKGLFTTQLFTTGGQPPYHYTPTPGATPIPGMRVQDGQPLPTNFSTTGGYIGVLADSGVFQTSIRVTDSAGAQFDRAITVTVSPLAIVSQFSWPKATVGVPYSFSLARFGGTGPYSYAFSSFQAPPPGLTVNSQGVVSGTPTSPGVFNPQVVLTDLGTSNSIQQGFTVTVDPFSITTAGVLPQGVVGTPYTQTFTAPGCGSGCTWTMFSNFGGLTFSPDGVLSGTPTGSVNTSFTVQVAGSAGTVQKIFSFQVRPTTIQPLVITNTSIGPSPIGNTQAQTLVVQGGTPPYVWSVQSGDLPPGITLQAPGETIGVLSPGLSYLAGRAMEAGTFTFTLAVTDATNATATRTLTWNISRLSLQYFNLPITGTPLINNPLVYNTAYTQPLLAVGGTGSYTWALITPLPPGLALNAASGVVSGTPTNTGSVLTQIQATDTAGNTNINFLTINVSGPTPTVLGFSSGPSLGTLQQGFSFSFNVTPTGGTPPYLVTATTPLPAGFGIESGDSLLGTAASGSFFFAGVPLATGPSSFTLQAQDAAGNIGVRTFTFTVVPYTLFSSVLHDGSVGVPYSQTLMALNGAGLAWAPFATTPLPPGLSVSAAGVISGTPQAAGTFNFTLTASDSATGTSVNFGFSLRISQIAIADPAVLPQVAIVGQPFSYTFTGGASAVWSATGLPSGLAMSATGTISGTPNATGTFNVIVTVTDGIVPISQRFTLFSRLPIPTELDFAMASTALADTAVGQSTTFQLNPSGGMPPYHWAIASGSSLPPGLQLIVADLNLPNTLQGVTLLAGAPTTPGVYTFDLILTDSAVPVVVVRRTFTLNVSAITILNGAPRSATMGTPYSQRFLAVGGTPPYTFSISPLSLAQPVLPPGLSLSADGVISGTPTSTGVYNFRLRAQDAANRFFSRTYTLVVNSPSGLSVTSNNTSDIYVGGGQRFALVTSGTSTYAWSLVSGSLPPGINLATLGSTTFLSGAASVAGTFTFALRAVDTVNAAVSAERTFTVRVSPMQLVSPPVEIFNVIALPAGQVGSLYSFTFKVAGGVPPYTISQSPFVPLPPGMSFNGLVLSGTPQAVGSYIIQPIITDSASHVVNSFQHNFTVAPAGAAAPLIRNGANAFPDGSVGVPYVQPLIETGFAIRGGTAPFAWSVAPGSTLPPGLVLLLGGNGLSNLVGGVPTSAGSYAFSLVVSDAGGQTLTMPFTQTISTLALTPTTLAPGTVGTPYSALLVPSGGLPPYAIQLDISSSMPPGLSFNASGQLAGTPNAPGNFDIFGTLTDSGGHSRNFEYFLTIDNPSGEAPGLSVAPRPIQVYYTTGSPAPAPVRLGIGSTSGNLPFNAIVTGIPGATLSAAGGTTSSTIDLNLNVASLSIGTYNGLVAAHAPESSNRFDAVPVTVTVAAPVPCTFTLNPQSGSMPATGGSGSFSVSAGAGCSWTTAGPPPSIATITSGASGAGSGAVGYSVVPNTSANARTLTFTVGGQQHIVTQFGATGCTFAINPSKLTVSAAGGSAQITVTPSLSSCAWTASGLGATPATGTGNGSVTVTIPPNAGIAPLTLTATIATKTLTVIEAGAGCTVGLSPYNASATSDGGPGSVAITTPAGCAFDTSGPSWISVTSGGSGSSSGTLLYNVNPNSTTVPRVGSLTIGGQTLQVTQDALACSVTIDTSRLGSPHGPAGGTGLIGISTNGANCAWTASSDSTWAQLNTAGGSGNGTIGVTIQSNASSVAGRAGVIAINGQTVGIQQSGTACTFSLQSSTGTVPASGGSGSVGVVSPSVCTWSAVSSDPSWLAITSAGGAGSTDVQFVAQPNPLAAVRTATLTIAGMPYTVTESAAPCTYTLSSSNVTVASAGATGSFTFSTTATGCSPNPVSYANWISATPSFSGTAGTVQYIVAANPGNSTRVGTIRVGEQNFTVAEIGGACGFSLNSYSALVGPLGDTTRSVFGSPSALGCTPVVGTNQPSFITLGSLSGPLSNIFTLPYGVSPFSSITPSLRFGNITFGGQIFVVKQTSY